MTVAIPASAVSLTFDHLDSGGFRLDPVPFADVPTVTLKPQAGSLSISINFIGGLSASQQTVFSTAKATWEGLLGDYQASVLQAGPRPIPVINAQGIALDGVGGLLGSAGPTAGISQGGFILATAGLMRFDTADLDAMQSNGSLLDVVTHEMGHVLGYGTLWSLNGVYTDGTGRFTGAHAVSAYRTEFNQPGATFVPVELGGGSGTANGHWNEADGGNANTGITQVGTGKDMRFEMMTGWLNTPTFISQTTVASFQDIGFAAIPEPAQTAVVLGLGGGLFVVLRRWSADSGSRRS